MPKFRWWMTMVLIFVVGIPLSIILGPLVGLGMFLWAWTKTLFDATMGKND